MQGVDGFCLAIQPTEGEMGTIGRKFAYFSRKIYWLCPYSLFWREGYSDHKSDKIICRKFHDGIPVGIW